MPCPDDSHCGYPDQLEDKIELLEAENKTLKEAWDALPRSEAVDQLISARADTKRLKAEVKKLEWVEVELAILRSAGDTALDDCCPICRRMILRSTGDSDGV